MAKGHLDRIAYGIIAYSMIVHLFPAACGETHIRSMQVREKRAVFAWVPLKNVKRTGDSLWLPPVYGRVDCPRRRIAFIESENGADFVIDFEFTKVGSLLRPVYTPVYAADEIAFVKAIPCGRSNFDEQEPAEGHGYVGDGNCRLPIADCQLPILNSALRHPVYSL